MISTEKIGRYDVLAEIGHGETGTVYQGYDPELDRVVAIKAIPITGDAESYLARFFIEARAAGRLSHPGIVNIFDAGKVEKTQTAYLVMEYVAGLPLDVMLRNHVPVEMCLQLTKEIAGALDYAHQNGVVHREIKPSNILVSEEGHAKISDFGVAKVDTTDLTILRRSLAHSPFMSPEQVAGNKVDGRSDLYSLGVVLSTMLTGSMPETGQRAKLPPQCEALVRRATASDPSQRFQTGQEFAAAIQQVLEGKYESSFPNVAAKPESRIRAEVVAAPLPIAVPAALTPLEPSRRFPLGVTVAALLVALLAVAVFGSSKASVKTSNAVVPAAVQQSQVTPSPFKRSSAKVVRTSAAKPKFITPVPQPTASALPKPAEVQATAPPTPVIAAAAPVPAPPATKAGLVIHVEHEFTQGEIAVWVDDKLAFTDSLHGQPVTLKKQTFIRGDLSRSYPVVGGFHQVRVQVTAKDQNYQQVATAAAPFTEMEDRVLEVRARKNGGTLDAIFAPR